MVGFTCGWLSVPLDHAGTSASILHLAVGIQSGIRPIDGVLLFLTGGPGQPGVSLIPRVMLRLGAALSDYRLVMFDQRGTGAAALQCPALQADAGSSDLAVVPDDAVANCAAEIGTDRRYFTTPETVADVEALRVALGVNQLTLDGVSYGTYVAERYTLTYPRRVAKLVLDSVVPQQGIDPLYLAAVQAAGPVLRSACAQQGCQWDPARDLQAVVNHYHDGPELLNALVAESIAVPSFAEVLKPLHQAAEGNPQALDQFLAAMPGYESAPADELSQGLHESTLCMDLAPPWDPQASSNQRALALRIALARIPAQSVYPFNPATVYGNGLAQGCLQWPPTAPAQVYDGDPSHSLPPIPILLLVGARDLSTPLAWARQEAMEAPDAKLVVVPEAGHSVQTRAPPALTILAKFLDGRG
jgi:pimeloyl-ACP methyl ester carboxylesterase